MQKKFKIIILSFPILLFSDNIVYATGNMDFSIGKAILKLIFYTFILLFVLIITIFGTKFIAKNTSRFANSKYMKVIDTLNLSTNTKLIIVEINNKEYIFIVANNTIEIVDKIPKEEFNFNTNLDFEQQLDTYRKKILSNNEYFNKFKSKINSRVNRSNKSINGEDEENEKKY